MCVYRFFDPYRSISGWLVYIAVGVSSSVAKEACPIGTFPFAPCVRKVD